MNLNDPKLTWRDNPWLDDHKLKELGYTDAEYSTAMACAAVHLEFERAGTRRGPCKNCGDTTWWKPSIAGYKCPGCMQVVTSEMQYTWEVDLIELISDAAEARNVPAIQPRSDD